MNRTEQKERLTDIIDKMQDAIDALNNNKDYVESVVENYIKVYDELSGEGYDILELDVDEFTSKVVSSILTNQANMDELQSEISEFKDEIESYTDEVSEARAEKLQERYGDLEEVYDSIYALTDEDDVTLQDALDELSEKIVWLKTMKK